MVTEVQEAILRDRFYHPHESNWYDVCERAARTWGDGPQHVAECYMMMRNREALPNTPALANAGRKNPMGSACFVLPVNDSLTDGPSSIMQTLKDAAAVHKSGGGTGFSFGRIRGKGELVTSTGRPAPGAVNVLQLYSDSISRVTQAGMRPGANMGILPVHHPDILDFIKCKEQEGTIRNFNISVAVTDEFMDFLVGEKLDWEDRFIWESIIGGAWRNGEPGVVFIDTVNRHRIHPELIEATNPCGEVPLRPYEACVLGSLNLDAFVDEYPDLYDWGKLQERARWLTRMLDTVVERQHYPLPEIEREQKRYRKIGVGVMGYADALIRMGIQYGSDEAIQFAKTAARKIQEATYEESENLAIEHGPYPGYEHGLPLRRNLMCQVVAPTGTISRLAGCSFGIEPVFAAETTSFIVGGQFVEQHPLREYPAFLEANAVSPEEHVSTQAAFQKYVDQAVSKTVNLPCGSSRDDVDSIYRMAWESGCKGITVLREGSRDDVVLENTDCKDGVCAF